MSKQMLLAASVIGAMLSMAGVACGQGIAAPEAKPVATAKVAKAALNVGDKAPALSIEKFVRGDSVTGFEKGKVYVVEFWATWCGPCIRGMPHLTKLQKEYKDKGVTIIGVTSEDPNNSLADVEKMASEKKDVMAYTVAWDKGRETNKAYMDAAMQSGIPTAFIVDQTGTLAWVGHPMEMDKPLEEVVAGKWDIAKAKADFAKELVIAEAQMVPSNIKKAIRKNDFAAVKKLAADGLAGPLNEEPQFLNGIAWTIVDPAMKVDFAKNKDVLELAIKAAEKANALTKNSDPMILDTYATALFAGGDKAKAIEVQTRALKAVSENKELAAEQREELTKELGERLEQFKNAK
jgi:thiol-disulfide isomerase/thioredoxin